MSLTPSTVPKLHPFGSPSFSKSSYASTLWAQTSTALTPLAGWANKGEKELLSFLLSVGVTPCSLDYDDAIAGAVDVKAILAKSGLPEAEVTFVEMVDKRLGRLGGGPRLLPLDPIDAPSPTACPCPSTEALQLCARSPHCAAGHALLRGHGRATLPPRERRQGHRLADVRPRRPPASRLPRRQGHEAHQ